MSLSQVIAAYPTEFEAATACQALASAGIEATVQNSFTATTLWHVGSAIGGAKVLVREEDAAQARAILQSLPGSAERTSGQEWFCGTCEEFVDAEFDLCWSCGRARNEVEQSPPVVAEVTKRPRPLEQVDSPADALEPTPLKLTNPYHPPLAVSALGPSIPREDYAADESEQLSTEDELTSRLVQRAWNASILGMVFLPFLMHAYSTILLLQALDRHQYFQAKDRRGFYQAGALNFLVFAVFLLIVRSFLLWGR